MWYDKHEDRYKVLIKDRGAQDKRLEDLEEMVQAMRGHDQAPKNRLYEMATIMLGQFTYQNPALRVESMVPGDAAKGAAGMKWAMEAEVKRQGFSKLMEHVGVDFMAAMGVTVVTEEDNTNRRFNDNDLFQVIGKQGKGARKRAPKKAMRPLLSKLSPRDFCFDSETVMIDQARRMAHSYVVSRGHLHDRADNEDGWRSEDISGLKKIDGRRRRGPGRESSEEVDADEVRIWEMWVPEVYSGSTPEGEPEGFDAANSPLYHGTIFTMAEQDGDTSIEVREPRLYRGPADGPYQVYWGIPLPDEPDRLSIFQATNYQRKRNVKHGQALDRSSMEYRKTIFTTSAEVKDAWDEAEHNSLVVVNDIDAQQLAKSIVVHESGGADPQMVFIEQRSNEDLDTTSGVNANKRGNLSAGSTATEAAIANEAGDIRVSLMRESFHRSAQQALHVMAWHMWHNPDTLVRLPMRAAKDLDPDGEADLRQGILYQGGDGLDLIQGNVLWEDLMIEIVPYSMQRTSEAELRQKSSEQITMTKELIEIHQMDPEFPVAELADMLSAQNNTPGLGKLFEHYSKDDAPDEGAGGFSPADRKQPPPPGPGEPVKPGQQTGAELAVEQA